MVYAKINEGISFQGNPDEIKELFSLLRKSIKESRSKRTIVNFKTFHNFQLDWIRIQNNGIGANIKLAEFENNNYFSHNSRTKLLREILAVMGFIPSTDTLFYKP